MDTKNKDQKSANIPTRRVYEWCPCGSGKKARKCCFKPRKIYPDVVREVKEDKKEEK